MLAWHACNVMAPHLKKRDRPSPKDLLGGSTPAKAKRKKRKRKRKRNLDEGA